MNIVVLTRKKEKRMKAKKKGRKEERKKKNERKRKKEKERRKEGKKENCAVAKLPFFVFFLPLFFLLSVLRLAVFHVAFGHLLESC